MSETFNTLAPIEGSGSIPIVVPVGPSQPTIAPQLPKAPIFTPEPTPPNMRVVANDELGQNVYAPIAMTPQYTPPPSQISNEKITQNTPPQYIRSAPEMLPGLGESNKIEIQTTFPRLSEFKRDYSEENPLPRNLEFMEDWNRNAVTEYREKFGEAALAKGLVTTYVNQNASIKYTRSEAEQDIKKWQKIYDLSDETMKKAGLDEALSSLPIASQNPNFDVYDLRKLQMDKGYTDQDLLDAGISKISLDKSKEPIQFENFLRLYTGKDRPLDWVTSIPSALKTYSDMYGPTAYFTQKISDNITYGKDIIDYGSMLYNTRLGTKSSGYSYQEIPREEVFSRIHDIWREIAVKEGKDYYDLPEITLISREEYDKNPTDFVGLYDRSQNRMTIVLDSASPGYVSVPEDTVAHESLHNILPWRNSFVKNVQVELDVAEALANRYPNYATPSALYGSGLFGGPISPYKSFISAISPSLVKPEIVVFDKNKIDRGRFDVADNKSLATWVAEGEIERKNAELTTVINIDPEIIWAGPPKVEKIDIASPVIVEEDTGKMPSEFSSTNKEGPLNYIFPVGIKETK